MVEQGDKVSDTPTSRKNGETWGTRLIFSFLADFPTHQIQKESWNSWR